MSPEMWIAGIAGLLASAGELLRQRIPAWVPVSAAAAGVAWHIAERGWPGLLLSLAGAVSGISFFVVLFWLGGGGDARLMSAFGAVLGSRHFFEAALWMCAVAAVLAAGAVVWSVLHRSSRGISAERSGREALSIPYAPALAVGAWLALVIR